MMKIVKDPTAYYTYALESPFSYATLDFCRNLKNQYGFRDFGFEKKNGAGKWRFNHPEIILTINSAYPDLILEDDVQSDLIKYYLKEESEKEQKLKAAEIRSKTTSDLEIKGLKGELYPYQKVGVEFLINNNGRAMVTDQPGLGKSCQALAYVVHTQKKKTLVICPASVKYVWDTEIAKWTSLNSHVINSQHTLIPHEDFDIFVINYDILKKFSAQLQNIEWDCLIADEFHYLKTPSAKRTREVLKLAPKIPSVILLSGTPLLSRPAELYTGLKIIDSINWPSFYSYTKRYCAGHMGRWGYEYRGATNIPELRDKISAYFIRRTKEEVLKDLPPKRFINYPIVLDDEHQEFYNLALKNFREYLAGVKNKQEPEIMKSLSAEKLVRLGELRQIISNGKIETAKDIITELLDNDEKLVVYSVYNKPLETLAKHFPQSVIITGKTSDDDRIIAINKFQNDPKTKIFFGGIKSAGVGITLTAAATVLFIDYSWVPSDHAQAQDRIHRIGQKASSVSIYQLYAKNTIDQDMQELLAEKQALFNELIEQPGTQIPNNLINKLIDRIATT